MPITCTSRRIDSALFRLKKSEQQKNTPTRPKSPTIRAAPCTRTPDSRPGPFPAQSRERWAPRSRVALRSCETSCGPFAEPPSRSRTRVWPGSLTKRKLSAFQKRQQKKEPSTRRAGHSGKDEPILELIRSVPVEIGRFRQAKAARRARHHKHLSWCSFVWWSSDGRCARGYTLLLHVRRVARFHAPLLPFHFLSFFTTILDSSEVQNSGIKDQFNALFGCS
jgi:hypothetical protein